MNDELNRALAEAMGWEVTLERAWGLFGIPPGLTPADVIDPRDGTLAPAAIPDYATDINALRDGPERMLREAGWAMRLTHTGGRDQSKHEYAVDWFTLGGAGVLDVYAPTEAQARASAALRALELLREPHNEWARSSPPDGGTEVEVGYEREAK